jgi:hypothetical protein
MGFRMKKDGKMREGIKMRKDDGMRKEDDKQKIRYDWRGERKQKTE